MLLTRQQAAKELFGDDSRKNVARLERWAASGFGPPYLKAGKARCCRTWYPLEKLEAWRQEQMTS